MDSLPTEALHGIMENLSISDAESFAKVKGSHFAEVRIDPIVYLGRMFRYPMLLLATMADTGAAILGSTSVEYFVPGSRDTNSDCDIYVPAYIESVTKMMIALQTCGVVWETQSDLLRKILQGNPGTTVALRISAVKSIHECMAREREPDLSRIGFTPGEARELYTLINSIMEEYQSLMRHRRDNPQTAREDMISELRDEHNMKILITKLTFTRGIHGIDDISVTMADRAATSDTDVVYNTLDMSCDIINGVVSHQGRPMKVQLITHKVFGNPVKILQTAIRFHSTHVQCFISGWCAVHLFHDTAVKKQSTRWNNMNKKSVATAIAKYSARGYTFAVPSGQYCVPNGFYTVGRGPSKIVSFKSMYSDMLYHNPDEHGKMCDFIDRNVQHIEAHVVYETANGHVKLMHANHGMKRIAAGPHSRKRGVFSVLDSMERCGVIANMKIAREHIPTDVAKNSIKCDLLRSGKYEEYVRSYVDMCLM